MEKKQHKECNCKSRCHWFETIDGKTYVCFVQNHHGEKHVVKVLVAENKV